MNRQHLQQQINRQNQWADELARQPPTNRQEPSDSQRQNLQKDDHPQDDA